LLIAFKHLRAVSADTDPNHPWAAMIGDNPNVKAARQIMSEAWTKFKADIERYLDDVDGA